MREVLKQVTGTIADRLESDNCRPILVVGDTGFGKSTTIGQVFYQIGRTAILQTGRPPEIFPITMRELVREISRLLESVRPSKLVVLVDELVPDRDGPELLGRFGQEILLVGTVHPPALDSLAFDAEIIRIPPISSLESARLFTEEALSADVDLDGESAVRMGQSILECVGSRPCDFFAAVRASLEAFRRDGTFLTMDQLRAAVKSDRERYWQLQGVVRHSKQMIYEEPEVYIVKLILGGEGGVSR